MIFCTNEYKIIHLIQVAPTREEVGVEFELFEAFIYLDCLRVFDIILDKSLF